MRKRLLPLTLALALCLGLTVPAFAKDLKDATEQDILNTFTIYRNGSVDEKKGSYAVDTLFQYVNEWELYGDEDVTVYEENYSVISTNDTFTITNTGGKELSLSGKSDYEIYAMLYVLERPDWYSGDSYVSPIHGNYWLAQNYFLDDALGQNEYSGYTVMAKAGETITIPVSAFSVIDDGSGIKNLSNPENYFFKLEIVAAYGVHRESDRVYYEDTVSSSFYFRVDEAWKAQIDAAGPVTPTTPAVTFNDVPATAYYADAVAWAIDKSITNGTNDGANGQPKTFSPDKTCTHAEILTFLYRADRGGGAATADDMTKAVSWAQDKGMIDGTYNGNNPCTRADTMKYIWQAFGKESAASSNFTDVPASADYAAAVSWAVANGITNGTNDGTNGQPKTFSPGDTCTRGQIVTFLHRAYVPAEHLTV